MRARYLAAGIVAAFSIALWLGWKQAGASAGLLPSWGSQRVEVVSTTRVVPGPGLPGGLDVQASNNNLDVVRHEGRVWLAFRTAPSHYASSETELHVLSSEDEKTWRLERTIHVGSDLREPRMISFKGRLFLYFARLGTNRFAFDPDSEYVTVRESNGTWSTPQPLFTHGFIGWRARVVDGKAWLVGYVGGGDMYRLEPEKLRLYLLQSDDGLHFEPVDPAHPVAITGGGSESDFVRTKSGGLVAVVRNETGNGREWGSYLCTAPPGELGAWNCRSDPRKFDSPLMFRQGDETYLVARRNVTPTGRYDLGLRILPDQVQTLAYELEYITRPKRCSLWRWDPEDREVHFVLDLPSRGDTCFAATLPGPGPDERTLYDYSSSLDGGDPAWVVGQNGRTFIYRHVLKFEPLVHASSN